MRIHRRTEWSQRSLSEYRRDDLCRDERLNFDAMLFEGEGVVDTSFIGTTWREHVGLIKVYPHVRPHVDPEPVATLLLALYVPDRRVGVIESWQQADKSVVYYTETIRQGRSYVLDVGCLHAVFDENNRRAPPFVFMYWDMPYWVAEEGAQLALREKIMRATYHAGMAYLPDVCAYGDVVAAFSRQLSVETGE